MAWKTVGVKRSSFPPTTELKQRRSLTPRLERPLYSGELPLRTTATHDVMRMTPSALGVASTDHRGARRICRPLKSYGEFGQSYSDFVMLAALHSSSHIHPRHQGCRSGMSDSTSTSS